MGRNNDALEHIHKAYQLLNDVDILVIEKHKQT